MTTQNTRQHSFAIHKFTYTFMQRISVQPFLCYTSLTHSQGQFWAQYLAQGHFQPPPIVSARLCMVETDVVRYLLEKGHVIESETDTLDLIKTHVGSWYGHLRHFFQK